MTVNDLVAQRQQWRRAHVKEPTIACLHPSDVPAGIEIGPTGEFELPHTIVAHTQWFADSAVPVGTIRFE